MSEVFGRSLVLAADVEPENFEGLVGQMKNVDGLSGVKVGFEIGLGLRLCDARDMVKDADPSLVVTYDHQKAATDIPDTAVHFARTMERGGVDNAILFPFTGPKTQERWTRELQDRGISVISGGEMTHEQIAATPDGLSEGYVHPAAFVRMYMKAIELGVRKFVVPGNKPDKVTKYKEIFDRELGEGEYSLWAPGFLTQGGDLSETGAVAGPNFNAIVGSAIYKAENPHLVAVNLGQKVISLNN